MSPGVEVNQTGRVFRAPPCRPTKENDGLDSGMPRSGERRSLTPINEVSPSSRRFDRGRLRTVHTGGTSTSAPDMTAYHLALLTAAFFALAATVFSLTIHDCDAAKTIVCRRRRPAAIASRRPEAPVPEGSPA